MIGEIRQILKREGKAPHLDIVEKFDVFLKYWDNILKQILEESIPVGLMQLLNSHKPAKFDIIQSLYQRFETKDSTNDTSQIRTIQERFAHNIDCKQLLKSFWSKFWFQSKYNDANLNKLGKLLSDMDVDWNKPKFTLSTFFKAGWSRFECIGKSLKSLGKYQRSRVAVKIWHDIVNRRQKAWSMKPLKDMNTFDISVWLRDEHRNDFVLRASDEFGIETVIHWLFDAEIDGIKLGVFAIFFVFLFLFCQ